ncbi:hypothetical protein [Cryptosporangium phraense]|uniref:Uncharacterized protein n=1 Tax=Cryptosporangium phraense TaxID=2593070 RepID=A0A545ASN1_9ACTN|nr:hypothetical protein [Cryptosporangium phraense]TQS44347.1 hypothetical protein FL583_15555 [Cryptosporangium phraense]
MATYEVMLNSGRELHFDADQYAVTGDGQIVLMTGERETARIASGAWWYIGRPVERPLPEIEVSTLSR